MPSQRQRVVSQWIAIHIAVFLLVLPYKLSLIPPVAGTTTGKTAAKLTPTHNGESKSTPDQHLPVTETGQGKDKEEEDGAKSNPDVLETPTDKTKELLEAHSLAATGIDVDTGTRNRGSSHDSKTYLDNQDQLQMDENGLATDACQDNENDILLGDHQANTGACKASPTDTIVGVPVTEDDITRTEERGILEESATDINRHHLEQEETHGASSGDEDNFTITENHQEATSSQEDQPQQFIPPPTNNNDAPPVFMIPSLAGTRLRTWSAVDCSIRPFANFQVGGSVWLDIKRLIAQPSCWVRCLKLIPETQEDEFCVTRPDEGLDAITQVDETLPTGFLWKDAIVMLAKLGYQPGTSMLAHPYDWRLPPKKMEERDRSFSRLKSNIERVVVEFRSRNPSSPIRGVFLVAFSMGNLFLQYFFEYLEHELGRKGMEQWVDKHVYGLIMSGAPFFGSVSSVESVLSGETVGLPIQKEQSRDMMLTWGSMPWMMPNAPSGGVSNKRHMAMTHGDSRIPLRAVKVTTKDGVVFDPPNESIVKTNGWFGNVGDNRLLRLQRVIDRWYGGDAHFNEDALRKPFVPPKTIDHVICSYGTGVATPVRQEFEEDAAYPGYFKKTDDIISYHGEVRSTRTGNHVLPRHPLRKSGDGTVSYVSLSWCHSWFGEELVNITKIPASRKYEEDEIERFDNIDVLDPKQLSATQKRQGNTFFTRRWIDVHPESGMQRPKSMQVWEFEGVTHRDSVTHSLFLRIWKDILMGTTAFSRAYISARKRVNQEMWEALDESGTLDSISNDWLTDISREGVFVNSNGKSPASDQDCYWNYAEVRCDRPRYCEYQYRVGDVHLSQSCRLRGTPLDKDDPTLLLLDAVAHNVSYSVAPNQVEWQTVYRNQVPRLLQPWAQLFLAFIGGATALAILLYIAFRKYGVKRFFPALQQTD